MSIQLEKVGLRDKMLNSFIKKKKAMGGSHKNPRELHTELDDSGVVEQDGNCDYLPIE